MNTTTTTTTKRAYKKQPLVIKKFLDKQQRSCLNDFIKCSIKIVKVNLKEGVKEDKKKKKEQKKLDKESEKQMLKDAKKAAREEKKAEKEAEKKRVSELKKAERKAARELEKRRNNVLRNINKSGNISVFTLDQALELQAQETPSDVLIEAPQTSSLDNTEEASIYQDMTAPRRLDLMDVPPRVDLIDVARNLSKELEEEAYITTEELITQAGIQPCDAVEEKKKPKKRGRPRKTKLSLVNL